MVTARGYTYAAANDPGCVKTHPRFYGLRCYAKSEIVWRFSRVGIYVGTRFLAQYQPLREHKNVFTQPGPTADVGERQRRAGSGRPDMTIKLGLIQFCYACLTSYDDDIGLNLVSFALSQLPVMRESSAPESFDARAWI